MARRPDNLETVHLALELLRRIPRSRKVSAADLHKQLSDAGLERDIRTIQRQLEALSKNFDIERDDDDKPYGYRWKEQARGFSLPALSPQESLLLALAEQHLRNLLPTGLMKSMDGFFRQARRNLGPNTNSRRERQWLKKVRVVNTTQPLLPPKIKLNVFDEVTNALFNNLWLTVDYMNSAGTQNKSDVMPLGLAQQGSRLYLVCRYYGFKNERILALNRIITAKATTLPFEQPEDFDFEKYDGDGSFGYGQGQRINLSFRITKSAGLHLLESQLASDQAVVESADFYKITATVVDTAQLDWWLNAFGDQVSQIVKTSPVKDPTDGGRGI